VRLGGLDLRTSVFAVNRVNASVAVTIDFVQLVLISFHPVNDEPKSYAVFIYAKRRPVVITTLSSFIIGI
jgi:hypothetical protein